MPVYVDGFVLPVPKKNLPAYRRMAKIAAQVWKDHGALSYHEAVGDDFAGECGLPFPKLVKPKPGETIVFAWITYKSRAHRDRVNKKVMQDPRLTAHMDPKNMPFDCSRMSWGGFSMIVSA